MTQLSGIFDTSPLVISAYDNARAAYESWATIGAGELPIDTIDAMQVRLMRWQRVRFGDQSDERMALGVIEEITECQLSETVSEAFDALGDTMVFAGQLAMGNRLALRPIIQLATVIDEFNSHTAKMIVESQGVLAQVVLKSAQKIRGLDDEVRYRKRLVGALAHAIARCGMVAAVASIEDDESVIEIDYNRIYVEVGEEVSQRSVGHDAIPKLVVH